jgi:hypothetical protein
MNFEHLQLAWAFLEVLGLLKLLCLGLVTCCAFIILDSYVI